MGSLPPVARLALVFSGGAAMGFLPGRMSLPALLAVLASLAPIPASRRPDARAALCIAALAGLLAGAAAGGGLPEAGAATGGAAWAAAHREALAGRIDALYGDQAPLVGALTLARRQGLDPELREDFARSGTAHLLAISGFHVGVVAGVLLVLLRRAGVSRRRAGVGAAGAAWLYVALLGFPDAATRAALILGVVAVSRAGGRPPARWGGLGLALLVLVALDPARLALPGFQLSFAGAAGLVAWAGPVTRRMRRVRWLPDAAASSMGAGVAATLATLPIVAWHFERVSLVGIPATLLATPFVVVALPGAIFSLVADTLHPEAGRFLAGGVGLILSALGRTIRATATPEWASVWIPRGWVTVAIGGVGVALSLIRNVSGRSRRVVWAAGAVAGMIAWPGLLALQARGTMDVVMVDVGQGDALAVRTPAGRWVLVDAGPPWRGDPGGAPVVRALRRRGVRRLEVLVLTHPDLDHIGGAPAVLGAFHVAAVLDPAQAVGKEQYLHLLSVAAEGGTLWRQASAGQTWTLDGVEFRVLHPGAPGGGAGGDTESNDVSVVLAVRYGAFDVLLTGDAPVGVERAILPQVSTSLEVLKVGHHGSATSTDSLLLDHARPRVGLVSVGRRNRYGHPDPGVLRRLEEAGVVLHRSDLHGTVRIQGRSDGSFRVRGGTASRR